jgi:hypothetical protein
MNDESSLPRRSCRRMEVDAPIRDALDEIPDTLPGAPRDRERKTAKGSSRAHPTITAIALWRDGAQGLDLRPLRDRGEAVRLLERPLRSRSALVAGRVHAFAQSR